MRVLMIGPYPLVPTQINGGVAAATTYLSQALSRDPGIELIGLRITKEETNGKCSQFAWPIENLPLGRFAVSTLYARQKLRFSQIVRRIKPDIVHAQGTDIAGYLAVESGQRTVVTVHGLLNECAKHRTNVKARIRERFQAAITEMRTVQRADELIAISEYVTQYYAGEIGGRVHHIPNPVAPQFFHLSRRPEKGRYLFVGRISKGKGLADLVRAVSVARTAVQHVVLAGWAPDKDFELRLREEIRSSRLTDRFEFVGLMDEKSLLDEFSRAEALILPSYQETAPMVVQQAMAAGLAVIATRVGGIPFQVQDDVSGLLFSPGDIDRLRAIFERFQHDETLSKRLGEAGQAVAQGLYQADIVARATSSVYQTMAALPPNP